MVLYENGKREKFNTIENQPSKKAAPVVVNKTTPQEAPKQQSAKKKRKRSYFGTGIGWGNSFGGTGLKLQYVINGKIGIHVGGGYLKDEILYAGGIQFYILDNMYVDAQYGTFGVFEEWEINYNGYDSYTSYESDLLMGPSLLLGYDWYFTKHFGVNAALGASYDLADDTGVWLAADAGFIFRF